ncbi:MAG: glucosamine-6-phosphate deaminase [Pseudomonadota bacterium]
MKVLIFPDAERADDHVAGLLCQEVAAKPSAVLGLATGGTMERVYARVVDRATAQGLSFRDVTSFNLDEYWRVPPHHPASYAFYMAERMFRPLDMDPGKCHLPDGLAPDPEDEAERYEAAIVAAGGLDLQLMGLGLNGHIGFNEPTSSFGSRTRIKTLAESTRTANRPYFDTSDAIPGFAITMGIQTILEARQCVLLATGSAKARAVAAMVEGPMAAICPASALQMHRCVTVVLDRAAASELALYDYYQSVHPDGAPARVP